jgi:hypothetical protein
VKTISLWQPWGSLWLSGVKVHETRHWQIKDHWKDWKPGDRIAVHAAKRFEKDHNTEFAALLRRACGAEWYRTMPTGALLGSIAVTGCFPAGQLELGDDDRECGDFSDGRWAWRGADPIILPSPVPWKGSQGIFNVPDDIFTERNMNAGERT